MMQVHKTRVSGSILSILTETEAGIVQLFGFVQ
jgi:hypothetical protein